MKRSEIRYALFRCKSNTPSEDQIALFASYSEQLKPFDYGIEEFAREWDIDKSDTSLIVTGKLARKYNQETSLFTSEGTLKD